MQDKRFRDDLQKAEQIKMTRRKSLAIICILTGIVFLVDELWMFGLPIGHILPDLSEFH